MVMVTCALVAALVFPFVVESVPTSHIRSQPGSVHAARPKHGLAGRVASGYGRLGSSYFDEPSERPAQGVAKLFGRFAHGIRDHPQEDEVTREINRRAAEAAATTRKVMADVKKPLMSKITIIRTEMCWRRPNLMHHEKCLKFLGINCKKKSTNLGICKKFTEKVVNACMEDIDDEALEHEDSEAMKLHVLQCDIANDLTKGEADPHGDIDGDGVPNDEDKFPTDPTEWKDSDGDGIGDHSDPDRDGDGHNDAQDVFPDDPKEWMDSDHDGIGDNADKDGDNDGIPDSEDAFPADGTEWSDIDGDGIGDNKDADIDGDGFLNAEDSHPKDKTKPVRRQTANLEQDAGEEEEVVENEAPAPPPAAPVDTDGDGVPDAQDAFPHDAKESVDSDGDGIGDNSDKFPNDASEWADSDGDGVGDNKDAFPHDPTETSDLDGDGFGDDKDAYHDDPTEWADSDGDGVGDNADMYPNDPNCHSDPCKLPSSMGGGFAPAAVAQVSAPAPGAPGKVAAAPGIVAQGTALKRGATAATGANPHAIADVVEPWKLNKVNRPLPEQGFNEHSFGPNAMHVDGSTWAGDWQEEWPQMQESEEESIRRACEINPSNKWCDRYAVHGQFAR